MTAALVLVAALSFSGGSARFVEMRDPAGVDYVNVSGEPAKRFIVSSLGSGAALFDYDQDGDLDLYFVNGARLEGVELRGYGEPRLYRNEGGFRFVDVTASAGLDQPSWGFGCAVGDVDNDGLADLYLTNIGPNRLFRNRGDGTFAEVTDSAGASDERWGTSAAFFDAEADGDLDLYVANYAEPDPRKLPLPGSGPNCRWLGVPVFCGPSGLIGASDVYFQNQGDGRLVEATRESGLLDATEAYGLGVVAGDVDGDGDVDVYVANDSVPNFLYENDGSGHFTETALFSGVAYNTDGLAQAGMGVDLGDLDGDGRLDLFVTNFSHDTNTAYRNTGAGVFIDATTDVNLRMRSWFYLGWATRFADFDNDGDDDLFVANGHVYPEADEVEAETAYQQRNQIFWNGGDGRFREGTFAADDAMEQVTSSRGGAFGDIDDDGDVDIVLVNIDDRPSLLENQQSQGNWVGLRLVGTSSNRDAVGARVTLSTGERRQTKEVHGSGSFLSSSDLRLHFGLGEENAVDRAVIRWPSGREQVLDNLETGRYHLVVEPRSVTSQLSAPP